MESLDLRPALQTRRVLPQGRVRAQVIGEDHRFQYLGLLATQVMRGERGRFLHGREGEQLQQMVLDHVAGGTHTVVVTGARSDADVLGHGDLHVVHVTGVP